MTGPTSPPCMAPSEFASWQAANAVCSPRYQASSPCEDCTTEFAREQRRIGLCPMTGNAHDVQLSALPTPIEALPTLTGARDGGQNVCSYLLKIGSAALERPHDPLKGTP
jgi:hypothetical protein